MPAVARYSSPAIANAATLPFASPRSVNSPAVEAPIATVSGPASAPTSAPRSCLVDAKTHTSAGVRPPSCLPSSAEIRSPATDVGPSASTLAIEVAIGAPPPGGPNRSSTIRGRPRRAQPRSWPAPGSPSPGAPLTRDGLTPTFGQRARVVAVGTDAARGARSDEARPGRCDLPYLRGRGPRVPHRAPRAGGGRGGRGGRRRRARRPAAAHARAARPDVREVRPAPRDARRSLRRGRLRR